MSAANPGLPALRAGVAVAVPVLALTAHGLASGAVPGSAGVVLCVALGVVLAALVGGRAITPARTTGVLALGQLVGHPAAGVGDAAAAGGHSSHLGAMLVWHAVAIPASALLLVLVAQLYALVTSVLAVLTTAPALAVVGPVRAFAVPSRSRVAVVGRGAIPRAPPLSRSS
ncbi:hypothetical protein GOARA_056_00650 [Gordonia araii NBRC 100433]|uniref:Uncharacterized protein n=1 Tax=Gordonia araii NBRC 100433 TaxID=1073574 RepID=G7H393_9ACTN|nr:hypothetical protein [Gordonia araii]NNG96436.1 YtxH domain-containing protein [Gordonia araii NBRC 100433]GAB10318.1 hypothetical protein GOARA_056_00650 [Gordonia araii NBRC 100433]